MAAMKAMAVIAVATGVNRAELVLLHQEREESFRSFAAHTVFALFSEGARGWNTKPHRVCLACYRARRGRRPSERPRNRSMQPPQPEVATTLTQVSAFTSAPCQHRRRRRRRPANEPPAQSFVKLSH
ncbi:hypothetical protein LSAT2_016186, partial [Lamellibrachia satsuma]